ncbi:MAG TPA: GNAT family N-acetyltransferase [Mycobacteriales bacterium]|jgi:RimJ/RimL family protein N-acetyltransferase|nr:GNAT family N-acetyltransferase [Mycobacteriales bacterium]
MATPIAVPVLVAADVRLRPFRRDDADWVYYVSLDPELRRWLSLPDPYSRSHARFFIDRIALTTARDGRGADFAVEDRKTEIGLGWVGLHRSSGDEISCGFWLAADARRQGLMTQALRAACRWALTPVPDGLGASAVYWEAHVGNHASLTVVKRVGFTVVAGTVPGRNGPKWAGRLRTDDLRTAH